MQGMHVLHIYERANAHLQELSASVLKLCVFDSNQISLP